MWRHSRLPIRTHSGRPPELQQRADEVLKISDSSIGSCEASDGRGHEAACASCSAALRSRRHGSRTVPHACRRGPSQRTQERASRQGLRPHQAQLLAQRQRLGHRSHGYLQRWCKGTSNVSIEQSPAGRTGSNGSVAPPLLHGSPPAPGQAANPFPHTTSGPALLLTPSTRLLHSLAVWPVPLPPPAARHAGRSGWGGTA